MNEYTPQFLARFWAKVNRSDDPGVCWLWTASSSGGYGYIALGGHNQKAHRISYEIAYGPFDPVLNVLHTCDNPSCVNPRHLFLGTHQDNMRDRDRKGRGYKRNGEKNGRCKLSDEQVVEIRRLYALGYAKNALAKKFGVSFTQIDRIVKHQQR